MNEFARSDHVGERVEHESFIEAVDLNVPLQPLETLRVLLLPDAFVHLRNKNPIHRIAGSIFMLLKLLKWSVRPQINLHHDS